MGINFVAYTAYIFNYNRALWGERERLYSSDASLWTLCAEAAPYWAQFQPAFSHAASQVNLIAVNKSGTFSYKNTKLQFGPTRKASATPFLIRSTPK